MSTFARSNAPFGERSVASMTNKAQGMTMTGHLVPMHASKHTKQQHPQQQKPIFSTGSHQYKQQMNRTLKASQSQVIFSVGESTAALSKTIFTRKNSGASYRASSRPRKEKENAGQRASAAEYQQNYASKKSLCTRRGSRHVQQASNSHLTGRNGHKVTTIELDAPAKASTRPVSNNNRTRNYSQTSKLQISTLANQPSRMLEKRHSLISADATLKFGTKQRLEKCHTARNGLGQHTFSRRPSTRKIDLCANNFQTTNNGVNAMHHRSVQNIEPKFRSQVVGISRAAAEKRPSPQSRIRAQKKSIISNITTAFMKKNSVPSYPIGPQKLKSTVQTIQKRDGQLELLDNQSSGAKLRKSFETASAATRRSLEGMTFKRKPRSFKERLEQWRKKISQDMTFQDKLDIRDPQCVCEFAQQIYENMRKQESEFAVAPDYLQKVQTEIKDTSRAFLIEWVIDVHRKFRLQPETLYVGVHIIDQYMSRKPIHKSQLHLLGVTTILIAAKYEEIYPPKLGEFLQVSENKFSEQAVLKMEKEVLQSLEFKITIPSALRFLQRYKRLSPVLNDEEVFFYAQYIQEIAMLDVTLLQFRPSQIAAAATILAARQLKKANVWDKDMEKYSGYSEADLTKAVTEVRAFAVEINPKFIQTLRYKFAKTEFLQVSKHAFKF